MPKRQQFLSTLRKDAEAFSKKTGIPAEWALAMALNETGGDLSSPSLFGIKALPGQAGNTYNTWEVEGGKRVDQPASFRSYGNYGEAFDQLANNMNSERYRNAPKSDPFAFASHLQKQGWATDPDYAKKISRLAQEVGGSTQGGASMTTDPFAGTDFRVNPQRPAGQDPIADKVNFGPDDWGGGGTPQTTTTTTTPMPGPTPPDIPAGLDPEEAYNRAFAFWKQALTATPQTYVDPDSGKLITDTSWKARVDAAEAQVTAARTALTTRATQRRADVLADLTQAQKANDVARTQSNSIALAELNHKLDLIEKEQEYQNNLKEIAQNNALSLARQGQQQGFELGKQGQQNAFTTGEREAGQAFTAGERLAGQEFQLGKLGKEQEFNAEQNSLDREIRNKQNEIAAGNLNLNTALGQLKALLDAQPFTIPQGAEYIPGGQPGGGMQEAARLAGVSYNPANYRANTVPFDPAAVVRQTMGR